MKLCPMGRHAAAVAFYQDFLSSTVSTYKVEVGATDCTDRPVLYGIGCSTAVVIMDRNRDGRAITSLCIECSGPADDA